MNLPEAYSDNKMKEHIANDISFLKGKIKDFGNKPQSVKRATIDMTYNLGQNGFSKYKKMLKAIDDNDWATAAKESFRRGIGESRNKWTNDLFLEALKK